VKQLYLRTKSFINIIISSIAFYPTLLSVLAILAAITLMIIETYGVSQYIREHIPWVAIDNPEVARGIVSILIGSGFSVLVFTFSMVMLLLSQAANNYSPRVLPGLISDRENQFILGVFLSVIVYNIIVYINCESSQYYDLPLLAIDVGILLAFLGLANFVYFIHKISLSIQINNILDRIYKSANGRLQFLIDHQNRDEDFPDTDNWNVYNSATNGTIQNISTTGLKNAADSFDTKLEILKFKGAYILSDVPLFKSEKELDEQQVKTVLLNFNFSETELVADNYVLGFKQITEIAVKAMSPGINDPGTAINSIDLLTVLFSQRMQLPDYSVVKDEDGNPFLRLKSISFQELLAINFAAIRNYSKQDLTVMMKLVKSIKDLRYQEVHNQSFYDCLDEEIDLLLADAKTHIENKVDLKRLLNLADREFNQEGNNNSDHHED
jgi:uncharacterized membrane protein